MYSKHYSCMPSFHDLTTVQLKQAVQIREQIDSLQEKLAALMGGAAPVKPGTANAKRTMSAATKKKMATAQQARYAKLRGVPAAPAKTDSKETASVKPTPKKRTFSPETKAKLAAAMKARWAAKKQAS